MKYLVIALALFAVYMFPAGDGIPTGVVNLMKYNTYAITTNSVVHKREGVATGVWLNSRYVLTNCHVADKFYLGRGEYRPIYAVNYDESIKFKMNVVTCNNETDMALLKSHWPNHDVLPLNITRAAPNFGQIVYSAGYHEFLPLSPKVGYVGQHNFIRGDILMIMQMPLAMGDSGSPVFNKWGSLVGLVTSVYSMGPIPIADISFAVPIWDIRNFLQEHMK